MTTKERRGRFFEDFRLGQVLAHAGARTVGDAESALYIALTGARHPLHSADTAARALGYSRRPLDDFLVFNIAFGLTVPDVSLNAVANLGYAELRFLEPVFAGDTLRCESVVIGLKENSSRAAGVVYVRSTCFNQDDRAALTWVRWVMVHKNRADVPVGPRCEPELNRVVAVGDLAVHPRLSSRDALDRWREISGAAEVWGDYAPGDRINHPLGATVEEADHMTATRLYQNNSRVHFDGWAMRGSAVGRRLVYGGHVISMCRALSHDGLENVLGVLAVNGGSHVAPTVAGDTLYAFTEVLDKWKLPSRSDLGALRLRLVGLKNLPPTEVPAVRFGGLEKPDVHPAVVLDLDYTVLTPR